HHTTGFSDRQLSKELGGQVVLMPAHCEGLRGEFEDDVPELLVQLLAGEWAKGNSRLRNAETFAQCFLALLGTKGAQERAEVFGAVVVTVKLAILAHQEAACLQGMAIEIIDEQDVKRR